MTDEEELYRGALEAIRSAQQDRERQFPKIEALRRKWKDDLEELDGAKDPLWIQCLVEPPCRPNGSVMLC